MTKQLQQVFSAAAMLPEPTQDLLASWLLAEIADESEFDRKIEQTASQLAGLARDAIAEHHTAIGCGTAMNSQTTKRFRELFAALPQQSETTLKEKTDAPPPNHRPRSRIETGAAAEGHRGS